MCAPTPRTSAAATARHATTAARTHCTWRGTRRRRAEGRARSRGAGMPVASARACARSGRVAGSHAGSQLCPRHERGVALERPARRASTRPAEDEEHVVGAGSWQAGRPALHSSGLLLAHHMRAHACVVGDALLYPTALQPAGMRLRSRCARIQGRTKENSSINSKRRYELCGLIL
jgi:hypothetical protein